MLIQCLSIIGDKHSSTASETKKKPQPPKPRPPPPSCQDDAMDDGGSSSRNTPGSSADPKAKLRPKTIFEQTLDQMIDDKIHFLALLEDLISLRKDGAKADEDRRRSRPTRTTRCEGEEKEGRRSASAGRAPPRPRASSKDRRSSRSSNIRTSSESGVALGRLAARERGQEWMAVMEITKDRSSCSSSGEEEE